MATYVRDYSMTIGHSVGIEADSLEEAKELFEQLENGPRRFYYLQSEVFDPIGEFVFNWMRDLINEGIEPEGDVYEDDSCDPMDPSNLAAYLGKE